MRCSGPSSIAGCALGFAALALPIFFLSCGGKTSDALFEPSAPSGAQGGSGGATSDAGVDAPNSTDGAAEEDAAQEPTPCVGLGQSCASAGCCDNFVCNEPGMLCGPPEGQCPDHGAACTAKSDCCIPLNCSPEGFCYSGEQACTQEGSECSQHQDCCATLQCLNGVCAVASSCVPEGGPCSAPGQCCANLQCLPGGTCGTPSQCPPQGNACGDCVSAKCCPEAMDCYSSTTCPAAIECAQGCSSYDCVQQCVQNDPSGAAQSLLLCIVQKCGSSCG